MKLQTRQQRENFVINTFGILMAAILVLFFILIIGIVPFTIIVGCAGIVVVVICAIVDWIDRGKVELDETTDET